MGDSSGSFGLKREFKNSMSSSISFLFIAQMCSCKMTNKVKAKIVTLYGGEVLAHKKRALIRNPFLAIIKPYAALD